MVDPLILLLFVVSGAAAGWMGIHLLPDGLVSATTMLNSCVSSSAELAVALA